MRAPFWSERFEAASEAELRRLEAPLLAEQIAYVYDKSPFYRRKFDESGVRPDQVRGHEALETVPFTEKFEITEHQRQGALFGPHQCARFEDIVRIVGTGGTSGQPTRIGWTQRDIDAYSEMGARALWAAGCRPTDMVINCFNYSLYAGGVMDHMAFETLGAGILPYGVGKSERLLNLLAHLPPDEPNGSYTLYATPSYAVHLDNVARALDLDVRSFNIRKGIFSGETGLQSAGYRARIEEAWGMQAQDLYGIAEVGAQSGECEHRCGFHYGGNGLVITELIDPDSGAVLRKTDGASGELVYTTLRRRACPLVRFRTHDLVRIHTEPCRCGRTSFRFQVLGRSDDMLIVKGANVFPISIQECLLLHWPDTTGEFLIILDRPPPIDYPPRLCIEIAEGLPRERLATLRRELVATIRRRLNFTPGVELVSQGSISSEHKTKRIYRSYAGDALPPQAQVQALPI